MSRRILILPEYGHDGAWHGSGFIRLICPFTHPEVLKNDIDVLGFSHEFSGNEGADLVLVERGWRPDINSRIVENFINKIRQSGAQLLWMVDDNLFDRHPQWDIEKYLASKHLPMRILAREADRIVVTTQSLAYRLKHLNSNVLVLQNLLDERLLRESSKSVGNDSLTIGYMGTFSHLPDLQGILPALRRVIHRHHGKLRLSVLGVTDHPMLTSLFPKDALHILRPPSYTYPDFLSWMTSNLRWDISIAPLMSGKFNDCKSDIKLLDYGAASIAGVYSHVPAYANSVQDGVTGLLVDNTSEAWEDALEKQITDPDLRYSLGSGAHNYLIRERTLATAGFKWCQTLLEFVDRKC
ncbi:glycosyltransferase family 4 protein [Acidithiobacillus ferriphilus]|uniref:hypothetical protein n=1 Tax=Acidithiobacillus ferriphilus TaxID=1689834 RepID=UPI001C0723DE|nr:hypothetical protein [Acidithiobacillus ferriphilus]MBU2844321.1 glycosyltransferase family 4 protein [Acidithiobacillus ferriphilus]MEB8475827.1 hypothetical protein [Acidithiobacillus ferriphilus]